MKAEDESAGIRRQWEGAAPGWVRWEPVVARWMEPATDVMLDLAGVGPGAAVLDLACGAGSQTLRAAERVGARGRVVANDIAAGMLRHVEQTARARGLGNVTTVHGAAGDIDVAPGSFDAGICRLGLMLFAEPARALAVVHRALRAGGRLAVVVFTTPAANPFMAMPMQILLRHAGKTPPAAGRPGIFALGGPGVLARLLTESGFADLQERTHSVPMRLDSASQALTMMQEAFGAYRAVLADCPESTREAAWAEVAAFLTGLETADGFEARAEVLVAAGVKGS